MQVRGMTTHSGVCASSPCVTVAVRAEPHDPVFVGNSEAVKGVRSHHQEEVKHLKEEKKKVTGHVCDKWSKIYTEKNECLLPVV